MTRPDHHTSHYGWALWHLEQAENAPDSAALIHATAAQARATLAQIDLAEGRFEGSTWAGSHKRVSPRPSTTGNSTSRRSPERKAS